MARRFVRGRNGRKGDTASERQKSTWGTLSGGERKNKKGNEQSKSDGANKSSSPARARLASAAAARLPPTSFLAAVATAAAARSPDAPPPLASFSWANTADCYISGMQAGEAKRKSEEKRCLQ